MKKYRFQFSFSMGHDTNTSDDFCYADAENYDKAFQIAQQIYMNSLGKDRLQKIFNEKGLPCGYSPYFYFHGKTPL